MALQTILLSLTLVVLSTLQIAGAQDELVAEVTSASNSFSQELYKQVAGSRQNVIYSPFSIHSLLAMASAGARGSTLQEMNNLLGLTNLADGNVGTAYQNLMMQLNTATKVNLSTSNTIFANVYYTIKNEFLNEIDDNYDATVQYIDIFDPRGPETPINDYISIKTHDLINNMLPPGSITNDTLMVMINTIYFHGKWQNPFFKRSTWTEQFFVGRSTNTTVDMMHKTGYVMYKNDVDRKVKVVELPFQGNRFEFYIVLPNDRDGIKELEDTLTNGVDDLFQGMSRTMLELAIPKFKVETTLDLAETLRAMGMNTAFVCSRADFTGISESGPFCINSVLHKAVIDVTEEGTTAAAATEISVVGTSLGPRPEEHFKADHPFMFFLRDKQTHEILFQGKFSG